MTSLFLFSLILGGGLLAVSLVGDLFGGADADLDAWTRSWIWRPVRMTRATVREQTPP